jgi:hypothetical protein
MKLINIQSLVLSYCELEVDNVAEEVILSDGGLHFIFDGASLQQNLK